MSPDGVVFHAEGVPVAQGSKKAYVVKGRAVIVDVKGKELKAWRTVVAVAAVEAAEGRTFGDAVSVRIRFDLPRPKSVTRVYPSVAPDVDKLARAVLDALTQSAVIRDDSQVVRLTAEKFYGPTPGVRVAIDDLGGRE